MITILQKKPELLAPCGDLEKLKVAVAYGADAVYFGGAAFSLRAKAKNFSIEEMAEAVNIAHDNKVKAYITCNVFARNEDIEQLPEYLLKLYEIGADALIISDPGVFLTARQVVPQMEIHISTQANVTNFKSVEFWQSQGAKRIILARELSLREISQLREKISPDVYLESFVHGAMCMSYSGRCLLSNYLNGRDSNRGNCSQPCRYKYHLAEETRPGEYYPVYEDEKGTYIFNSKDLCMIEHLPELVSSGIDSFKIEGRMKTAYYVAGVVKAYREAIDDLFADRELYESKKHSYMQELLKTSHRHYTTGFYFGDGNNSSMQIYENSSYVRGSDFVGIVIANGENGLTLVEQRNKFVVGEELEIISPKGFFKQEIAEMYNEEGEKITEAPHPQQKIWLKLNNPVAPLDMIRRNTSEKIQVNNFQN